MKLFDKIKEKKYDITFCIGILLVLQSAWNYNRTLGMLSCGVALVVSSVMLSGKQE